MAGRIGGSARTRRRRYGSSDVRSRQRRASSYHNVIVVLDQARDINNGQPSALAHWINGVELQPGQRVYHLGSGVGYYTAIMAEVVGPGGSVVASEIDADLAARARANLSDYANVEVHTADGGEFDPGECDAMLINAGVTHPHPLWLERLREGGRLVLPITLATTETLGAGLPSVAAGVSELRIRDRTGAYRVFYTRSWLIRL